MTEELILKLLNVVWKRWPGALLHKCTMLVLDSFCGHMAERVKAEVSEESDLVILGGLPCFCNLWILTLIGHSRSLSSDFTTSKWHTKHERPLEVQWCMHHCWQCVNLFLHYGTQFLQKFWRSVSKLLEFLVVCISWSLMLTMKVSVKIMAMIAVSILTVNDANMLWIVD